MVHWLVLLSQRGLAGLSGALIVVKCAAANLDVVYCSVRAVVLQSRFFFYVVQLLLYTCTRYPVQTTTSTIRSCVRSKLQQQCAGSSCACVFLLLLCSFRGQDHPSWIHTIIRGQDHPSWIHIIITYIVHTVIYYGVLRQQLLYLQYTPYVGSGVIFFLRPIQLHYNRTAAGSSSSRSITRTTGGCGWHGREVFYRRCRSRLLGKQKVVGGVY